MALSINPATFIELFFNKKRRSRESAAAYLDSIAAEARNLANVWEIVVDEVTKGSGSNR